jgi:hypothetical protein
MHFIDCLSEEAPSGLQGTRPLSRGGSHRGEFYASEKPDGLSPSSVLRLGD